VKRITSNIIIKAQGNALFLVLIGIVLFAALSYAITASGRSGGGPEREQAVLNASRMVQYSSQIRTAVLRLMLTGVSKSALDFSAPGTAGYGLPSAEDEVFNPAGGGAHYDALSSLAKSGVLIFMPNIAGIGTTTDLTIYAQNISLNLCEEINTKLGIANPPATIPNIVNFDAYPGEPYACVRESWTSNYSYYHVLAE